MRSASCSKSPSSDSSLWIIQMESIQIYWRPSSRATFTASRNVAVRSVILIPFLKVGISLRKVWKCGGFLPQGWDRARYLRESVAWVSYSRTISDPFRPTSMSLVGRKLVLDGWHLSFWWLPSQFLSHWRRILKWVSLRASESCGNPIWIGTVVFSSFVFPRQCPKSCAVLISSKTYLDSDK
jgi:hypothetical protein